MFPDSTEAHYYLCMRMNDNANIWTGPVYVKKGSGPVVAVGDARLDTRIALRASPNPSLGQVTASFSLPRATAHGQLVVFDAAGRRVKTLLDGPLAAGDHRIAWTGMSDAGSVARSGVYFLRLVTTEQSAAHKILLMR